MRSKIFSANRLAKILKNKKQIVFTNGCFDVLHAGHVMYLQKAKALGKILVVALNSDESTRRLKGPSRPINSLKDRLAVIAALECVDYVTNFKEDTPLKTILKIRPNILVKGGDWKASQIVGGREVLAWGGKVQSLSFLKGRSTTATLKRITSL